MTLQKATREATQKAKIGYPEDTAPTLVIDGRAANGSNKKQIVLTFGTLSFLVDYNETNQHHKSFSPSAPLNLPEQQTTQPNSITNSKNITNTKTITNPKAITNPKTIQTQEHTNLKEKEKTTQYKTAMDTRKPDTVRRFLKPPPATTEWQQIVRKEKPKKRNSIKCYTCHKIGHTQKNCWSKLKCYNCGRLGHKAAKCLYKPPGKQKNKPNTNPIQQKNSQILSSDMEPNHRRPQFGEIFCPPRHVLNANNDYLCTVGLVILIRGSPSPALPRLIARTIAALHGGRPSDYSVYQATIAPYLINCPNTQVRNTIVQQSLYSIPQTDIQFTVHEWRPRFGMVHDPPSHQVWVKIIGLPLQAWTDSEIYAVLQEFGHPIRILPYGMEAGHFKDITALVDTNNPNRIPRVYIYREGTYSTQIEIVILTCRRWADDDYPPPPENAPNQQDSQAYLQQFNDQSLPRHQASSSASSDLPSEPTIDLSAWSPRSHQPAFSHAPKQNTKTKWIIRPTRPTNTTRHDYSSPISHTQPKFSSQLTLLSRKKGYPFQTVLSLAGSSLFTQLSIAFAKLSCSLSPAHNRDHYLATVDPTVRQDLQQIFSRLISPLPASNHIIITPLSDFRTVVSIPEILGTDQKEPTHLCYSLDFVQHKKRRNFLAASYSAEVFKEIALTTQLSHINQCPKTNMGLMQPKKPTPQASLLSARSYPAPPQITLHLLQPRQPSTPAFELPFLGLQSLFTNENPRCSRGPSLLQTDTMSNKESLLQIPSLPVNGTKTSDSPASLHLSSQTKAKKKKMNQAPTRRSQRLKEKMLPDQATPSSKPAKGKTGNIPFVLNSPLVPMDTNNVIQILNETGLHITEQVDEMIREAIERDAETNIAEQDTPSTPLHDPVPPLALPGEDLVL